MQRLRVQPLAFLQAQDVELGRVVGVGQQAAVVGAGFHQQGKTGQLGGAVVNVQAVEVFFQNQAWYVAQPVAALQVNRLEHVVGHHQNVAAAAGGVQTGDGFRVQGVAILGNAGLDQCIELSLHFGRLLGGLDVVGPFAGQLAGGVGHEPQAAHAVLHQVLHDPVGREQLGGGGNVFAFHHLANDLVFFLTDVELVEPANHFDFLPVFLRHARHQLGDDGVSAQQVVGQQQLGVVVDAFKQERHGARQLVALGHQQQFVELVVLVASQLQLLHAGGLQAGQAHLGGMAQQFGQAAIAAGEHAVPVVQQLVQFHVAQRGKAVEPGVGHLLHGPRKPIRPMPGDAGQQGIALRGHLGRPLHPVNDRHAAADCGRHHPVCRDAQQRRPGGDGGNEVFAGLRGVGLEVGFVHF